MPTEQEGPACTVGPCLAVRAVGFDRCIAHLAPEELDKFLEALEPGADLDARRTTVSHPLLSRVLGVVRKSQHDPISRHLNFAGAIFEGVSEIGPIKVNKLTLDGARFTQPVLIEVTADHVSCVATRFDGGVTLRAARAKIDATRTIFGQPSSIIGYRQNREHSGRRIARQLPPTTTSLGLRLWDFESPALVSLRGTDVSNLVLVDVDLSWCLFAGAHRLDQLRLEGRCRFNRRIEWWNTRRQMLAEEHVPKYPHPLPDFELVGYDRLAALYRSLRKALEDSKNEAGAGDFLYGEMEARRQSVATPWVERWILAAYWLLSGYGQRAIRALTAVVVLIATVAVLLFTVGLPGEPVWTGPRVEQSVRIAMGAVVLRDAGQQLTSAGSWTVMLARFIGPVLLALAALAVRARVKR